MLRIIIVVAGLMAAVPAQAQPTPASVSTEHARGLFERDWALMNWALKQYDGDGDRVISAAEAQQAAAAFRQIADGDGDGRVTPYEYRSAREFIIARY